MKTRSVAPTCRNQVGATHTRTKVPVWIPMLATALVGLVTGAACSSSEPETTSPPAAAPSSAAAPKVVFYGDGVDTKAAAITMRTESGGTLQRDVGLPIVNTATKTQGLESTLFPRGAQLYFSMQNKEGYGSVTCRIDVDGKKIDEVTSQGAYKIATCRGTVP